MQKAQRKRLIISAVYLAIFLLVAMWIRSCTKPAETCTDGIRNQNEQDIDCGGVCAACKKIEAKDLIVGETGILDSTIQGQYDFFGLVTNPNNVYGSDNFTYQIRLKDESGNVLSERKGTSFILPGDKKYIVETNIMSETHPASIEFAILDTSWIEFDTYYEKPDIKIVNKAYNEINSGVGFAEATGLLKNNSPFDFASIKIKIILRDASSNIIALNSTEMRTVNSGEERDFRASWPSRFQGTVTDIEAQPEVNVFSTDAFAKKYFKTQQFQQYK